MNNIVLGIPSVDVYEASAKPNQSQGHPKNKVPLITGAMSSAIISCLEPTSYVNEPVPLSGRRRCSSLFHNGSVILPKPLLRTSNIRKLVIRLWFLCISAASSTLKGLRYRCSAEARLKRSDARVCYPSSYPCYKKLAWGDVRSNDPNVFFF